jgi:hypothetical protein
LEASRAASRPDRRRVHLSRPAPVSAGTSDIKIEPARFGVEEI